MKGLKYDDNKPRWDLLPLRTVEDIVRVMTYGARKYAPNNWKKVKPKERYLAATLRHLTAWQSGERKDRESKLSHLAHALCSIMFLHHLDIESLKGEKKSGPQRRSVSAVKILSLKENPVRPMHKVEASGPDHLHPHIVSKDVLKSERKSEKKAGKPHR